ncbi:hypothetical protein SpiGrapes_1637 [Sphaerochaeta pleomorpha str. Grapes]|uniref:HEPN domain-containing protein n=1 Tax=Sphaerochaeta pleomorpha (strain ATCC BAA-1885 / DSM 22778 / Grapes) TaxID=158190 RepID=G8QWE6_SPHPG|nr:hypothetical protein [Sphaerochaeta pleomorpha]AEV29444.1 hypothetical protein SpiGrapes_1637 [Sphaerochaeta pleomorpha str. Grapes]
MGLSEKSQENLEIVDICLRSGHYNAGINRAYYAAFQKIKDYLEGVGFSNEEFDNFGNPYKPFSHGEIASVLITYLTGTVGVSYVKLANLYCYDDLYHKRKVADYYPNMMSKADLLDRQKQVIAICKLIDSVKEGRL